MFNYFTTKSKGGDQPHNRPIRSPCGALPAGELERNLVQECDRDFLWMLCRKYDNLIL
ncbi:hypothetical protein SBA7_770020 [Candidatus Sulfotelmatobacter sp. SbA7]|nr:hypothetical protein SBA7_770020 [Candidatus Sulfotelmatobacter sp. SbA7]